MIRRHGHSISKEEDHYYSNIKSLQLCVQTQNLSLQLKEYQERLQFLQSSKSFKQYLSSMSHLPSLLLSNEERKEIVLSCLLDEQKMLDLLVKDIQFSIQKILNLGNRLSATNS